MLQDGQVLLQQDNIRCFFGDVNGIRHRNANVGNMESGGVVDTIAYVSDNVACLFERENEALFLIFLMD